MPSVTPAQQRLMAQAYQVKKGALKAKDIDAEYREQIVDLADSMTLQQLKDFAETKHSDMKKESKKINEWLPGVSAGHRWYTQTAQAAAGYDRNVKDHSDKLIKSFMEFIQTGKKPRKEDMEANADKALKRDADSALEENAPTAHSAPQATPANTPGMGNVSVPGKDQIGSGDRFGEDDEEERPNVGIMSYERYKEWLKYWQEKEKEKEKK
jgi:hypothetical protein